MSLRYTLPDVTEQKVVTLIKKNLRDILLNTRLVGAKTVPDWQENLTEDRLLTEDVAIASETNMVSFESLGVAQKISPLIQKVFPDKFVKPSGFFHYPPTGYMGWHTNSNYPCQRMYLTWTEESGKSFFRYKKAGKVVTDYDDAGLTVRLFDVTAQEPYLWHCVGSDTDRVSVGLSIA
jgi:hypothetical protein